MLNIPGSPNRFCDGASRRSFLKVGAFAFGTAHLTLADLYRIEAAQPQSVRNKAVINVFLAGGPAHQDTWDIKTSAPPEIRGEFKAIDTSVPGIRIGEVFPKIAARMKDFSLVRSIVGARGSHDAVQCMTGRDAKAFASVGGWPSLGSVLAKVQGPTDPSVPPFIGLAGKIGHMPWADSGSPGFLGAPFAAFKPEGPDLANMQLNSINREQLGNRKLLLASFDTLRRDIDGGSTMRSMDAATERALNVLTSSRLLEALDISREPAAVRERYGDGRPYNFQADGAPTANDQLLIARRLVEAGARCVTLSYGRWDSHFKNFDVIRDHGSKLDQGLSALVDDLKERGMLDDVLVIAWGEMGRSPRINKDGGRDHWPQVSSAILAGGGIKSGLVVGGTDRLGERAVDRPVTHGDMFATIYKTLGLDPDANVILDPSGRPQHLAEGVPIRELVA